MIKSGAYIQLLQFFAQSKNETIIRDYASWKNLTITETCKRFDEIRTVHSKYKLECDSWSIYPNKHLNGGLDKLNGLKSDLQEICRQFTIRVVFYPNTSKAFKQGIHASYWLDQKDLTDLIVFSKERKPSSTSYFNELGE